MTIVISVGIEPLGTAKYQRRETMAIRKNHGLCQLNAPGLYHTGLYRRYYIHFVHSGYFYSASSSPLPLRGAPNTGRKLCRIRVSRRSATGNCEWKTCPRSLRGARSGRKVTNLPMSHHGPQSSYAIIGFWPITCNSHLYKLQHSDSLLLLYFFQIILL